MFEKIKKALKIHNFAGQVILKDGTEIMVEGSIESGSAVTIQLPDTDEPTVLPDGEYILDTDEVLVVKEGIIADVLPPADDEVVEEVADEEELAEEEIVDEEVVEDEVADEAPEIPEEVVEVIDEQEAIIEDVISVEERLAGLEEKIGKILEAMSAQTKLQDDFNSLKEKLEGNDGAKPVVKKELAPISGARKRLNAIKGIS